MIAASAAAQTVKLTFPDERPRRIWSAASVSAKPSGDELTMHKEVTVKLTQPIVCVVDIGSGNMASRELKPGGTWKVTATDYDRLAEVRVFAEGSKEGEYRFRDATSKEGRFFGVPAGEQTFEFKSERATLAGTFRLSLERDEPVPLLVIRKTQEAAPAAGQNWIGTAISILLVAGLAIAILVFGLRWIYSNPDRTQTALGKIGIQVPDPLDPGSTGPSPPPAPPMAPAPVQPIVLSDPVPPVPSTGSVGLARLVGPSGSFELTEGVHVIGREPTCTIPLVSESSVSRRHAEIVVQGSQMTLRDLGSTNGTFLNGQAVQADVTLRPGDTVRLGSVHMRIE